MDGDWILDELHRKCTSWLSFFCLWNGVHRVLPASGAMSGDHEYVSAVGVAASFVCPMAVGDGCFPLFVVLSFSFLAFVTLDFLPNNVTIIAGFCQNLWIPGPLQ